MKIFLLFLFLSSNGFALDWQDLEVLRSYKLKQDFQLSQPERSGSLLDFSTGDEVVLKGKVALLDTGTVMYSFIYAQCTGPEMETDIEILPVIEVEAQLRPGCELNLYIKSKNLLTHSMLE